MLGAIALIFGLTVIPVLSQSQANQREISVFTFPVDKTITVPLNADARFPGVTGKAEVDISSKGGAEVKVSISKLPAVIDLGGLYTTYLLWSVSSDGTVQRLSEVKSVSKGVDSTDIKATVPLTTFGLVVTAEPHALVRQPSRVVVLENGIPKPDEARQVQASTVRYSLTDTDYFRNLPAPDKKDKNFRKIPLSLLGARYAVALARFAGAETNAPDEYNQAFSELEEANDAYQRKMDEKQIDLMANKVISIAAGAEKKAIDVRQAQIAQREKDRKNAELNETKDELKDLKSRQTQLEQELAQARQDKERYQRDFEAKSRLNERLQQENDSLKEKSEKDSQTIARLQLEKELLQRQFAFMTEMPVLEQYLRTFGPVQKEEKSVTVTLPESVWSGANSSEFNADYLVKIQPMLAKIVQRKECELIITSYTDGSGDLAALQYLADDRAESLKQEFIALGFNAKNIKTKGFAVNKNTKRSNRRTEITLRLLDLTSIS